jgi:hypothetical protein
MAYALLALAQLAGLLMVPLGLPGTWLQVISIGVFSYATDWRLGWWIFAVAVALAAVAEVIEFMLGGRFARKYGGSKRAAWGAILGGLVGAFMGFPLPIIGSVIGAFIGAFVGAALLEMTAGAEARAALRVGLRRPPRRGGDEVLRLRADRGHCAGVRARESMTAET